MKRYIRTKDGIYELQKTKSGEKYLVKPNKLIPKWNTEAYEEIRQADTIEELCDCFVYQKKIYSLERRIDGSRYLDRYCLGGYDHHDTIDLDKAEIRCFEEFIPEHRKNTYGAIWTAGENGEPILKSIAKINEKGDSKPL